MTAFIWRRCLNSVTLANATHRELGKVIDGDKYSSEGLDDQQVEGEDD